MTSSNAVYDSQQTGQLGSVISAVPYTTSPELWQVVVACVSRRIKIKPNQPLSFPAPKSPAEFELLTVDIDELMVCLPICVIITVVSLINQTHQGGRCVPRGRSCEEQPDGNRICHKRIAGWFVVFVAVSTAATYSLNRFPLQRLDNNPFYQVLLDRMDPEAPGEFADLAASAITSEPHIQQQVLETMDIKERQQLTLALLNKKL